MIGWLAEHGGTGVLVIFFALFLGFGAWAYAPRNKGKMERYRQIPLKEMSDGE